MQEWIWFQLGEARVKKKEQMKKAKEAHGESLTYKEAQDLKSMYFPNLESFNDIFFHDPDMIEHQIDRGMTDDETGVEAISAKGYVSVSNTDIKSNSKLAGDTLMYGGNGAPLWVLNPNPNPITSTMMAQIQPLADAIGLLQPPLYSRIEPSVRPSLINNSYVFIHASKIPVKEHLIDTFSARISYTHHIGVRADLTGYFIVCDMYRNAKHIHAILSNKSHFGYELGVLSLVAEGGNEVVRAS